MHDYIGYPMTTRGGLLQLIQKEKSAVLLNITKSLVLAYIHGAHYSAIDASMAMSARHIN